MVTTEPPAVADDSADIDELFEDEQPRALRSGGLRGRGRRGGPIGLSDRNVVLDNLRYRLAKYTLMFVAAQAFVSMLLLYFLPQDRMDLLRELLTLTFSPIVALVSTCFAWFFASESKGTEVAQRRSKSDT